jgi:hypothetical protein
MSKRLVLIVALAAGAVALSGCVVVPEHPRGAYGHGYGYGYGEVRVVPPPVVVVPPRHHPRHRDRYPRRW